MGGRRCYGCRGPVRSGWLVACEGCWARLPLQLRREYGDAGSTMLGDRRRRGVVRPRSQVIVDIKAWFEANPTPSPEPREPLWKRPR